MVRNVSTVSRVQRESIAANQTKMRARKIRLFRNGDAYYKVRRYLAYKYRPILSPILYVLFCDRCICHVREFTRFYRAIAGFGKNLGF